MLGLAQREIRDKLFEEKNSFSKIHDINRVSLEVRFWLGSAREHYTPLWERTKRQKANENGDSLAK